MCRRDSEPQFRGPLAHFEVPRSIAVREAAMNTANVNCQALAPSSLAIGFKYVGAGDTHMDNSKIVKDLNG
jgi:hypothetical protein